VHRFQGKAAERDDSAGSPVDPEGALRALLALHPEIDPKVTEAALTRVREATPEELAVFGRAYADEPKNRSIV
jgi:hypothetical protein